MTALGAQTGTCSRKRTQGRLDIRLHATIKTLCGSYCAILENISKNGAKLGVQGLLATGSQVVLQWHGHEAFGTITWSSSTNCGVVLSSEVAESVLRATLELNETFSVPKVDAARLAARAFADGSTRFGFD